MPRRVSISISDDDARRAIIGMGMSDWHTNILLELLRLSREGHLSGISAGVKEVTGNKQTEILFPIRQRLYIGFHIGISNSD
jgi:hypothetical protein